MNFIDLFSGIGGFRLGMEAAGHTCLGHVEIDKFANKSYEAIFKGEDLIGTDITKVTDETWRKYRGRVDCICGGFPCQAFSIAGKQRGFADTRGTLFFEILRAAKEIQPSYLFLENVKNLLSHDEGKTFETMLAALDELGYDAEWKVCDSQNFGVPQHRERVFIIGHLRGRSTRKIFCFGEHSEQTAKQQRQECIANTLTTRYPGSQTGSYVIKDQQPKKLGNINPSGNGLNGNVYGIDAPSPTLTTNKGEGTKIAIPVITPERVNKRQKGRRFKKNGEPSFTLTAQDRHGVVIQVGNISESSSFGGNPQTGRVYDPQGISPTLNTMQGGDRQPKIIQAPRGFNKGGEHEVAPTLSKSCWQENNFLKNGFRIRKLTPRECWRLQGFPDWAFDEAQKVNSDSQLYKQAGNSVTVNVIKWIARKLKIEDEID